MDLSAQIDLNVRGQEKENLLTVAKEMRVLATLIIIAMILYVAAFIIFPLLVKCGCARTYGQSRF